MKQYNHHLVFNIQHYSLHDGSGIRTILFLKGCPLRCRWCCNPESQHPHAELFYTPDKCIGENECGDCRRVCPAQAITFADGKAEIDRALCTNCLNCAGICPSQAMTVQGKEYTVRELADLVERDSVFYRSGNGGLTVSGGEPLMHGEFLVSLLREAQSRYIDTAIETCGYAPYENLYEAAKYLDQILFDVKSMDEEKHRMFTGQSNQVILDNLTRLCEDFPDLPKKVRTPVVPGFNDTKADIQAIREFLRDKPNVTHEPLKYHSFGRGKYRSLGRGYPMGDAALREEQFRLLTE